MYFVSYYNNCGLILEEFKTKKAMLTFFENQSKELEEYFDIKKYTIIEGLKKELCIKQYAVKFDVE